MEYFWWLYAATRLDAILSLFTGLMAIGVIAGFVSAAICFFRALEGDDPTVSALAKKAFWSACVMIAIGGLGQALVPSKQDALFIAAGVGVIEGARALQGSSVAQKSVQVVEAWLDQELESLKKPPEKQEKKR